MGLAVSFSRTFLLHGCLLCLLGSCTFGVPIDRNRKVLQLGSESATRKPDSYIAEGQRYYVLNSSHNFTETGVASWYGKKFHGRKTSSGEVYDMFQMTAAHRTLPLSTRVKVTNLDNNKSIIVKVNDRGPFVKNRVIDLSYAAAKKLDMIGPGTARVKLVALTKSGTGAAVQAIPLQTDTLEADLYIQVGSFSERLNAQNVVNQLESMNEKKVDIYPVDTNLGVFYRVRLGPYLDLAKTQKIADRLRSRSFSQARVVIDKDS